MRGKVRRLLAGFAASSPGRFGIPPPATTSRCEELADGETCTHLCQPHEKRDPDRKIAVNLLARTAQACSPERRKASASRKGGHERPVCAEPALRPPLIRQSGKPDGRICWREWGKPQARWQS